MRRIAKVNSVDVQRLRNSADALMQAVLRLEKTAQKDQAPFFDGDVKFSITADGSYVVFEDVANGSDVIEMPAEWFEDIARKYLEIISLQREAAES